MRENKLIFFFKKRLYFIFLISLLGVVYWYRHKEPIKNKLKRWIFGEKNVIPKTILEQTLDDVK